VRAREHRLGRDFGRALFNAFKDVDGILFASRLTGRDSVTVRGRVATERLRAPKAAPLADHPELAATLEALQLRIALLPEVPPDRCI
jgi:hypothetical protein